MADPRVPLGSIDRYWAGNVKVTTADLDTAGIGPAVLALANTKIYVGGSDGFAHAQSLSGDATLANTGALTIAALAITTGKIAAAAVTNAKLANLAQGSIKVGGASNLVTDLVANGNGQILIGDGTNLNSVAVSGDITLTSAGVATIPNGTVTPAKASAVLKSQNKHTTLPTVTTTGTTEALIVCPFAGTVTGMQFAFKDALAQDATNWVRVQVINKSNSNVQLLANTDPNTTKTTTGNPIVAYTTFSPTLTGTSANLNVSAGDVLAVQFIQNGTAANTLTEGSFNINVVSN